MRLAVFRSLAHGCAARIPALARRRCYDGVELSLAQLTAAPTLLADCVRAGFRVVCRVEPADAADAGRQLDGLASLLAAHDARAVELVSIAAPAAALADPLGYLEGTLPRAARFLEAHPSVGGAHGKLTGHGKPVPRHVLGCVHELSGVGVGSLAELCDVFPPTRLSLADANLDSGLTRREDAPPTGHSVSPSAGLSDELDTVVLCTDHVYVSPEGEDGGRAHQPVWEEVWCAQQLDGARETSVTCDAGTGLFGSADSDGSKAEVRLFVGAIVGR